MYGDPRIAGAIGLRNPVPDLAEMRDLLSQWERQSSQSPLPQGLWAVDSADDGELLGGATLLPFSSRVHHLVMGWHLRPRAGGRGVAGQIGHALAHHAFIASDVDEIFVAAPANNAGSINVARRLGMTTVDAHDWAHRGVPLEVLRMSRAELHKIRPGVSTDSSYGPEGLDDW